MDPVWCGNNYYTIWIDEERTKKYDAKYVLHYKRWYNNTGGNINTWPVVSLWENTITEVSYVSEIVKSNKQRFENTNTYPTLKQEVIEWCNDVIGPYGKEWGIPAPKFITHQSIFDNRSNRIEFIGSTTSYGVYFRLKRHAMLFKLTWS